MRLLQKTSIAPSLIFWAAYMVCVYGICWISLGNVVWHASKCCLITLPNKDGDGARPSNASMKHNTITHCVSKSRIQWSPSASLSSFRILTWSNAYFMSPVRATVWNGILTSTAHTLFCKGGPTSRHSLREGDFWFTCWSIEYNLKLRWLCSLSQDCLVCQNCSPTRGLETGSTMNSMGMMCSDSQWQVSKTAISTHDSFPPSMFQSGRQQIIFRHVFQLLTRLFIDLF